MALHGRAGGDRLEMDEILLALSAAFVPSLFKGTRHVDAEGRPTTGFLTAVLQFLVRVWEESGGSMKDEAEILEATFSDSLKKSERLSDTERKKALAVIAAMQPYQKRVFRLALMTLDPETEDIVTDPTTKDGKVTPGSKRTVKTGVDPRVNVLRGIAEMVKDDLSNVREVVAMLEGTAALGSENKAVKALLFAQSEIKKYLCLYFDVADIKAITLPIVKDKLMGLNSLFNIPDPNLPLPGYEPSWLTRNVFRGVPGMPKMPPRPARERGGRSWMIYAVILAIGLPLTYLSVFGIPNRHQKSGVEVRAPQSVTIPATKSVAEKQEK